MLCGGMGLCPAPLSSAPWPPLQLETGPSIRPSPGRKRSRQAWRAAGLCFLLLLHWDVSIPQQQAEKPCVGAGHCKSSAIGRSSIARLAAALAERGAWPETRDVITKTGRWEDKGRQREGQMERTCGAQLGGLSVDPSQVTS
ncbi:hypothetical protein SKAU_G00063880 [Synaphobranchus kaupii]|uniref:Uncharacterized protein n=1 Tax=Synaphobranchus kaupii TaxID=118154 RepID=A0A9Q1G678_SYNKA|nr:hypothetical protein SKAU_G00063880 [Synaphobranchus kaupii]